MSIRPGTWTRVLPLLLIALFALSICWHSLSSTRIDDMDSAHHIMDGIYFRDLMHDLAFAHVVSYTYNYYEHYPALSLLIYPPVFGAVEGTVFLASGSVDMRVSRWTVLGFGVLLACLLYRLLEPRWGSAAALLGVLLLLSTPLISLLYNEVMLEVPAVAMALLAVFAYLHMVRTPEPSWKAVVVFAVAAAAAVYTKQTAGFVYAPLAVDLVVNHRALLRNRRVWIGAALVLVFLLPLAAFTYKFGRFQLVQSIGTDQHLIPAYGFTGLFPERWTVAAWLFYPRMLLRENPLMLVAGLAAAVICVRDREFFKANVIWLAWVVAWYLCFGYFLNKRDRMAFLWLPGLAALTAAVLWWCSRRSKAGWWLYLLPCAMIAANAPAAYRAAEPGFIGVPALVEKIGISRTPGNIAYFGRYHQTIVPFVRKADTTRQSYILRGTRILRASSGLADAFYRFRVRYVVVDEVTAGADREQIVHLETTGALAPVDTGEFTMDGKVHPTRILRYTGPIAPEMATIPLHSAEKFFTVDE